MNKLLQYMGTKEEARRVLIVIIAFLIGAGYGAVFL